MLWLVVWWLLLLWLVMCCNNMMVAYDMVGDVHVLALLDCECVVVNFVLGDSCTDNIVYARAMVLTDDCCSCLCIYRSGIGWGLDQ